MEKRAADLEWGCSKLRKGGLGVGEAGLGPRAPLGAPAVEGGGGKGNTTIHQA